MAILMHFSGQGRPPAANASWASSAAWVAFAAVAFAVVAASAAAGADPVVQSPGR